jgi:hypothetical protein
LALNAVLNFATEFVQWMDKVWTAVEDKAIERAAQLITFFASLPAKMVSAVAALPKELGDFFQGVWNHLEQKAEDAVFHIIQFFRDLPHHLTGFASEIGHGIVNFLKDFLNHAIDDINSGIAKIDDVVPGDLPRIPRLARGGIAFGPALIGENSNTAPEAAIPLGDARALAMLRNALGGTGTTINFASGAVIVNVNGSVTPQQAQAIGQQVGQGIANTLAKNNIRMAVRTA